MICFQLDLTETGGKNENDRAALLNGYLKDRTSLPQGSGSQHIAMSPV